MKTKKGHRFRHPFSILNFQFFRLSTVNDCRLPTADCQLPTADLQLTTYDLQLTTKNLRSQQPTPLVNHRLYLVERFDLAMKVFGEVDGFSGFKVNF